MNLNAKTNEYQKVFPRFDDTPKAVIAAIAYSFAMHLSCDDAEKAQAMIAAEWGTLHTAGIVPQRPKA